MGLFEHENHQNKEGTGWGFNGLRWSLGLELEEEKSKNCVFMWETIVDVRTYMGWELEMVFMSRESPKEPVTRRDEYLD